MTVRALERARHQLKNKIVGKVTVSEMASFAVSMKWKEIPIPRALCRRSEGPVGTEPGMVQTNRRTPPNLRDDPMRGL